MIVLHRPPEPGWKLLQTYTRPGMEGHILILVWQTTTRRTLHQMMRAPNRLLGVEVTPEGDAV